MLMLWKVFNYGMFLIILFRRWLMWFFILCVVLLVKVIVRIWLGWVLFSVSRCVMWVVSVCVLLVFVFVSSRMGLFRILIVFCCVVFSFFR